MFDKLRRSDDAGGETKNGSTDNADCRAQGWTGAPFGIGVLHLWMGVALATIELTVALTVLGTALFGDPELSHRAFRLLGFLFGPPWSVDHP